jgi:hypothetical protein
MPEVASQLPGADVSGPAASCGGNLGEHICQYVQVVGVISVHMVVVG